MALGGMVDVVLLGEAMLRLSPSRFTRLEQANQFQVVVGGSELSVAANLARLGTPVSWVTALPNSPLGRMVWNAARQQGVETGHVTWREESRLGLYFYEEGAAPRPSQVIYDRKGSAFSTLTPGEIDWAAVLQGARLFHTSGITPALSESCRRLTIAALQAARERSLICSFDLNFRSRLWDIAEARRCFLEIAPLVDVLFASGAALRTFFGLEGNSEEAAHELRLRYQTDVVVLTERTAVGMLGASVSSIAVADRTYEGKTWEVEIVDRLGTGDAYDAGFLHGYLRGDVQMAVDYAGAMAALKHTVPGEYAWLTEEDVRSALEGVGSQVQR